MHRNTKIATCSYCGTRSALVLDAGRHELVCPACGAPLHEIKAMPVKAPDRAERGAARPRGKPARPVKPRPDPRQPDWPQDRPKRRAKGGKRGKRRKRFARKLLEEAVDLIEDIFD
jgi:transcription initiation factor TFIIIB Brf1 subunit/transcription initiation factor TFIIB